MYNSFFKRISRTTLFVICLLILVAFHHKLFICYAQRPQHKIVFGLHGGKSDYVGDWGQTLTQFKKPFLQSGIGLGYELPNNKMLRINYTHGIWGFQTTDSNALNRGFRMVYLTYLKYLFNPKLGKSFNPYWGIGTGIRMISGNYKTVMEKNRPNFNRQNMVSEPIIIVTFGISANLNKHLACMIEINGGLTANDNLDGRASAGINLNLIDYHFLPSLGIIIKPWIQKSCPSVYW